ncbi:MAG: hypothetical protein ABSB09_11770 [Acidimicrobiales bacterium]|jgi:hypothetical protein
MTIAPPVVPELGDAYPVPPHDRPGSRSTTERAKGLGRLPELALAMAAGSGIVAVAYAGARYGHAWAGHLFWLGQAVIYAAPAAFLLLRKRILAIEATGIALLMPVITFLVNQYYSPGQFRFSDEFAHVQTAQSILATHHLFHLNTNLPQSPQYPGLEIITTGIVSITHVSITTAGLIVAGGAHVVVGAALFFLILETCGRPRVGALAVVLYATGSHYQFFDSYFIYETVAIPFLLLSLLATVKMMKSRGPTATGWGATAVACGGVTAVCHHVTSYALVALLLAFVIAQLLLPSVSRSRGLPIVFLAVAGIVVIWDLGIATSTVSYFRPVIDGLLPGHSSAKSPNGGIVIPRKPGVSEQPPLLDTVAEYLAFAALLVLAPLGAWKVWHTRRSAPNGAALGLAIASLSIFVTLVLRVAASDGSELASRAMTFALIPVSFVCALVIVDRTILRARPAHRVGGRGPVLLALASTLVVVVLAVGGIASGWPPYFARLPGPYKVSAWERSVDEHNLDTAQWFADSVPPDQGVASDYSTEAIISALGHQAEVQGIAGLFLPLTYSGAQGSLVRSKRVSFIAVDRRITEQLPATGYYFKDDPEGGFYSAPLPTRSITKFDGVPGVSRVYDDGTIVVYEIIGSEYYK